MGKLRALMVQAWDGGRIDYFVSPPLGINRVRKWAENKLKGDVSIECFDPNLYTDGRERLNAKLRQAPYDVIAFSPLHLTMENDLALMHDAHRACPNAFFLSGGQQSAFAADLLQQYAPFMNVVVTGEGEKPFTEILRRILTGGLAAVKAEPHRYLKDIPGLFINGHGRNPGFNYAFSPEEFTEATDLVDFKDMNIEEYWRILESNRTEEELRDPKWQSKIYTLKPYTTNYCPMNCHFCSTTNFYREAGDGRAKVVGVRGEWLEGYLTKILENQPKARTIMFKDDLWFIRGPGGRDALLADLAVLKRVRERFPERDIRYHGKARVDTFITPGDLSVDTDLLIATREAGFVGMSYGIESFDTGELEYYNKRLGKNGPEVNRRAVLEATKYGLNTVSYIILSGPVSTPTSLMNTLEGCTDLVSRGEIVKINAFLYSLPGTEINKEVERNPSLAEKKTYPVPGYPGLAVERVVKIFPQNELARDITIDFERRLPTWEAEVKKSLGVTDWISEFSTPAQLDLLLACGLDRKAFPEDKALAMRKRLHDLMKTFKRQKIKTRELTFA